MGDLISVIVIDEKNSPFRERCLNSLKRQTYEEIETAVITDADSRFVMEACQEAQGEYLFFCSVTSILQENTIEELYKETLQADGNVLMCADIYTRGSGVDYHRYSGDVTLYGKLFRRSILSGIQLAAGERNMLWRWELLVKYMAGAVKMVRVVQAIVYETSLQDLEDEEDCREDILEKFYEILVMGKPDVQESAHLEVEEPETEQKDKCIKYTYGFYEDQEGRSQYLVIRKEYPVPEVIHDIQKEVVYVPAESKELTGVELSEYIVRKFGQGNLGLMTIIRAMAAWLRYKLKVGGQHEKV